MKVNIDNMHALYRSDSCMWFSYSEYYYIAGTGSNIYTVPITYFLAKDSINGIKRWH